MVSSLIKSEVNSEFTPMQLWQEASAAEIEIVIQTVYRQVLGNTYVMESERLVVPESLLKHGEISVREFVRQVAKSELYRLRFFENCYRYRAIELNFKHLLGRAPANFEEMRHHSDLLDQGGYDAEIDSYVDSEEYQNAFGEDTVPFYRGQTTYPGQSPLAYTNMVQLLHGAAGSDKGSISGDRSRLQRALLLNSPFGQAKMTDVKQMLAELFQTQSKPAASVPSTSNATTKPKLQQQVTEQEQQITRLQQQLAELRPFADIGAATLNKGQSRGRGESESSLQARSTIQSDQIAALQAQIAEARALAAIGEYRLNKWRSRMF